MNKSWNKIAENVTRKNVSFLVWGDTGTGRSTLGATLPGPIAVLNSSEKLDPLCNTVKSGNKSIYEANFAMELDSTCKDRDKLAKESKDKLKEFVRLFEDAKTWARTIIIDTDTALYEIVRYSHFRGSSKAKPQHYAQVNAYWDSIFSYHRKQDIEGDKSIGHHLVFLSKSREKYLKNKPTGKMEPATQKNQKFNCDVVIETTRDRSGGFISTCQKGWYNAEVEGQSLENETSDLKMWLTLITKQGGWDE